MDREKYKQILLLHDKVIWSSMDLLQCEVCTIKLGAVFNNHHQKMNNNQIKLLYMIYNTFYYLKDRGHWVQQAFHGANSTPQMMSGPFGHLHLKEVSSTNTTIHGTWQIVRWDVPPYGKSMAPFEVTHGTTYKPTNACHISIHNSVPS